MAKKLTYEQIKVAAKEVDRTYHEEGYSAGKKAADELKAEMIKHDNTDSDSTYTYKNYSGFNWD